MEETYCNEIQALQSSLDSYAATTTELIMQYHLNRYKCQKQINAVNSERGSLTIRSHYCEDIRTLRIEILNARHLKPSDSNGI